MSSINKYNFVDKRELHTRDNPKRFKKFKQIIDSQYLGLRLNQYNELRGIAKILKKREKQEVLLASDCVGNKKEKYFSESNTEF